MKNIGFISIILLFTAIACDKIDKPYPPVQPTELDQSLYPGNWSDYPWPDFTANSNTNLNIMLEDYTGHKCVYCPAAADIAKNLETNNPGRVFVSSVHISPGGVGPFQTTDATYTHDFTNPIVIKYGETFQSGYGFDANPSGTINRKIFNGNMFQGAGTWSNHVTTTLSQNTLKANLQAKVNFYPATKGLFLHVEVDTMALNASDLAVVASLMENKFISVQKFPAGAHDDNYEHHNILRANIDGRPFGREVISGEKKSNGKYYLNYSYKIPDQYTSENTHVLVYVMNKTTYEVYQVIKATY